MTTSRPRSSCLALGVLAALALHCGDPSADGGGAGSGVESQFTPQPPSAGLGAAAPPPAGGGPVAPPLAGTPSSSGEGPPASAPLAPPLEEQSQSGPVTPVEPPSGEPSDDPSGEPEPSPPSEPAPAPTCATPSSLPAGNTTFDLEHDGARRTYIVHVPQNLDPGAPVPLVVDMHGLTSSATQQAALSGWREKADEEGFIVVHPQGLNASWNGGDLCCGSSQRGGVDDEGFIRALVAEVQAAGCVDPKRIYATGLSNGGAMSHLLACNAADLFAASAPVSMGNGTRPCQPSRPISIVLTRGTRDTLVSFNGGLFPSAQADFDQWASLNGCQGTPAQADELCEVFTGCEGGVEVKACALDAGHVLYDNAQGFSVPDVVWATFERQALP